MINQNSTHQRQECLFRWLTTKIWTQKAYMPLWSTYLNANSRAWPDRGVLLERLTPCRARSLRWSRSTRCLRTRRSFMRASFTIRIRRLSSSFRSMSRRIAPTSPWARLILSWRATAVVLTTPSRSSSATSPRNSRSILRLRRFCSETMAWTWRWIWRRQPSSYSTSNQLRKTRSRMESKISRRTRPMEPRSMRSLTSLTEPARAYLFSKK